MKFAVGQPLRRFEDLRLITGRGRYTDDIVLPGMVHAHVLRSTAAHARIARIDATRARGMPGVLLLLTGEDVTADGLGDVPCVSPLTNRDGTPRHDTPRPVLAIGKVRHAGQPVALVVAEKLHQARDAAEAIEVEYEALPAVVDARAAIGPGAPQLFDHIPRNIVFDWDNDRCAIAAPDVRRRPTSWSGWSMPPRAISASRPTRSGGAISSRHRRCPTLRRRRSRSIPASSNRSWICAWKRPTGRASRRGAPKPRNAGNCAASAWRPIPSAAAAAFRRRPRSSSRTTASSSSWAMSNMAPASSRRTSSSLPIVWASTPTRSR